MLIFSLFIIAIVLYGVKRLCAILKMMYLYNKFDGPEYSSLIFGHLNIIRQPGEILYENVKRLGEKYYPHWSCRVLFECVIVACAPEDFETFLSTSKHSRKSIMYNVMTRWLRDGLVLSSGEKWLKRRKILTPAFHFSILKDFIENFNDNADRFLKTTALQDPEGIDVIPLVQKFALLTIKETVMGHKSEEGDHTLKDYRKALAGMEDLINKTITRPWLTIHFIRIFSSIHWMEKKLLKTLHGFTETIVKDKMENFEENKLETHDVNDDEINVSNKKRKHMAMLDILIQAHRNNEIDYKGVCEEVDTFTFGGHDTVSSALGFCLLMLANHPDIQDQVFEEITDIVGDRYRHSTYEDLTKMELLERCIKETLRIYPSAHIISRTIDEETKLSSGLIAPKNGIVHISIFAAHRNPDIYPDPEKFDPDRFLPENCQRRHPFAYIPFSAGPRNCIGQRFAMLEMKVLLSAIIKNFQLLPVDTPQNIVLKMESILRTTNGIKVKFVPRIK